MDEALDIIDNAEKRIVIGSPFFPGGVVAQRLRSAGKKGIDIHAAYDHPNNQGILSLIYYCTRVLHQVHSPKNILMHPSPQGQAPLHAKIIASEKTGILTSHNFTPLTVRMGMTEIGLVRHKRKFAESISSLLLQSINKNTHRQDIGTYPTKNVGQ
jgi:phosphatidylserine/phosphatidylglycerophosphate/cardiolipin synthase-like enzyme